MFSYFVLSRIESDWRVQSPGLVGDKTNRKLLIGIVPLLIGMADNSNECLQTLPLSLAPKHLFSLLVRYSLFCLHYDCILVCVLPQPAHGCNL